MGNSANGSWFLFYCGLMLLWVMGDLRTLAQFQRNEMLSRLFQDFRMGTLRKNCPNTDQNLYTLSAKKRSA